MSEKYQNLYRIPSARMQNWDYGWNAPYFITICTQNRACCFGEIMDGEMKLTEIGEIAHQYWMEISTHFPFVHLGAFVIMPNHVHGVIIIDKPNDGRNKMCDKSYLTRCVIVETPESGVSRNSNAHYHITQTPESGVSTNSNAHNQTSAASKKWKPASLGVIINQYKRKVTLNARNIIPNFTWQTRFHDHIIKNHESYVRIEQYIMENPMKWIDDQFY